MKKCFLTIFSVLALVLTFGLIYVFAVVPRQNPSGKFDYANINGILSGESHVFYRDGKNRFGAFFNETHRFYVKYDSLPKFLIDAVVAAEDAKFWEHKGFDIRGIARAIRNNIENGYFSQGGSTITQQTVKNLFGREEHTFTAKIKEFADALRLERKYRKSAILEFYLNQFHVTGNGKGIGVASVYFFDKNISELNLEECAFIAGILKAPNYAEKNRIDRTKYVLRRMLETNKITREQYDSAKIPELNKGEFRVKEYSAMLSEIEKVFNKPFFKNLFDGFGIDDWKTDGLKIFTTLDKNIQDIAMESVKNNLLNLQTKLATEDSMQGGLAAIQNGEVLAAWSGQNNTGWFNRIFEAERQFGSVWKPMLYALALKYGWDVSDSLENEYNLFFHKNNYYFPHSSHKGVHIVNLEQAIAQSENIASIWLLTHLYDKLSNEDLLEIAEKHSLLNEISQNLKEEIAFERVKKILLNDWRINARALQALHYGKNYEKEIQAQKKYPDRKYPDRIKLLKHNYLKYLTLNPDKYGDDYELFTNFAYSDFKRIRDLVEEEKLEPLQKDDILLLPDFRINLALKEFSAFCKEIGINSSRNLKELLNAPLGVNETTIAEMTVAYSSIISGKIHKCKYGEWGEPCIIKEIRNSRGNVIFSNEITSKEIFPEKENVAEHIQNMLAGVFKYGTGKAYSKKALKINAIGKTGTSNENRTVAFFGALQKDSIMAVGSYAGFDDNQKLTNKNASITGANGALPQWIDFAEKVFFNPLRIEH
jgi:membrane peptidoglycan carboxypeptidase